MTSKGSPFIKARRLLPDCDVSGLSVHKLDKQQILKLASTPTHRFLRKIRNLLILICGWILETWGLKSLGVLGSSSVIVPLKSKPMELNSFQILNVGPNGTHKNSDIFKI